MHTQTFEEGCSFVCWNGICIDVIAIVLFKKLYWFMTCLSEQSKLQKGGQDKYQVCCKKLVGKKEKVGGKKEKVVDVGKKEKLGAWAKKEN